MADLSKLKRRSTLGDPPPPTEASENLAAPEHGPPPPMPPEVATPQRRVESSYDGRSARRTGRTLQFATRVSPDFDERLRAIARRDGLLLVEVLERALDAYEAERQ
jgi:hypothetical protein